MIIRKSEYSHIGGRPINEDACICQVITEQKAYAVVADGLGGHGSGNIASQIAVKTLSQCAQCQTLPTEGQILQWFQQANSEIIQQNQSIRGMKTTAVFLALFHGCGVWAHVGDSRLYHFFNGQLQHYTCDHSVPQVQVLSGTLTREQIPHSPDRSRILKALGGEDWEPEIAPAVLLSPGQHAFLLCTDGFWEHVTEDEIWLDLNKSDSPAAWLTYLRCRGEGRRGGDADNNTAVALFVDV